MLLPRFRLHLLTWLFLVVIAGVLVNANRVDRSSANLPELPRDRRFQFDRSYGWPMVFLNESPGTVYGFGGPPTQYAGKRRIWPLAWNAICACAIVFAGGALFQWHLKHRFRLNLGTCCVLMLVTAALLWANLSLYERETWTDVLFGHAYSHDVKFYGWPEPVSGFSSASTYDIHAVLLNSLVAILILLTTAFVFEIFFARRRSESK